MFKRLSKARRHSADEVGCPLPSTLTLDEPPGFLTPRKSSEGQLQGLNAVLLRPPRSKYGRKSCGDAVSPYTLLTSDDNSGSNVNTDTDYQMVTAMPAFIVEHEPEKQKGLGVWGLRRMGKKIESFRKAGSRETINSITPERTDPSMINNNNNNNNNISEKLERLAEQKERRIFAQRSPSPFKSFFIRMGSTGMLNSNRGNKRSPTNEKAPEKENLFRSCSTSQLNTSPTYVKGDDPSEGIDLQINSRKDKTLSCDNLSGRSDDDVFDDRLNVSPSPSLSIPMGFSPSPSSRVFSPCDFGESKNDSLRKSSSCDFKEVKKTTFPYSFLRSKLSVLPEERYGSGLKDERLFKTTSEEHFPALEIEESFEGTTTLGRRRPRNGHFNRNAPSRTHEVSRMGRNSYAECRTERIEQRCEQDRYSLNPSHLERIEDDLQMEDAYENHLRSPLSLPQSRLSINDSRFETSSLNHEIGLNPDADTNLEVTTTTLRNHRRNSAPSGEQRLSSHYVSSNESGYDSDGPRGESAAASENETQSLKCNTDSSDTSSVVDSELEKPMRRCTSSECQEQEIEGSRSSKNGECEERIDGLRWHQSNSGRMLPSIHQTSPLPGSANSHLSLGSDGLGVGQSQNTVAAMPHRARLQQDKTRFLSDIIEPPKKVRRCRLVQLIKNDPKESLGIRLAQQRIGEIRYIVVQLETDGIAHRDGRLRLGDEIVEVEGKELRTLESLEQVQEYLKSFSVNKVRLITAYEETVPQVCSNPVSSEDYEYMKNVKNLTNMTLTDSTRNEKIDSLSNSSSTCDDNNYMKKRPDFLPVTCITTRKDVDASLESSTEIHQYLTRHIARFEKGYGKPSLGFSVVGGRDSPRGEMGIFVRRVFPGGQADVSKSLFQGDEILSLNGKILRGCTHQEVIELFKAVREGPVELEVARRHRYQKPALKSAPY